MTLFFFQQMNPGSKDPGFIVSKQHSKISLLAHVQAEAVALDDRVLDVEHIVDLHAAALCADVAMP